MPRPVWSGVISFGLVSIPVKLFNAVNKKSISFNQLDQRDMSRIKYRKVSASTGEEVPDEEIVKGYEITKGRYVVVDPDELEPLLPVPTRAVELEEFVDLADIDPVYYDSPYIVAPDKMPKPYALLVQAMESQGKVGIARFVMRNKQYLAALRAKDGQLLLSTMVRADEVVDPATITEMSDLDGVDVSDRERAMAAQLVESLSGPFEPERFPDTYRVELLGLIERKASGEAVEAAEVPAATAPKVVDLMAALEASVAAAKEARGRHPSVGAALTEKKAPRKATGRKKAAASDDEAEAVEAAPAPKRARARKSA